MLSPQRRLESRLLFLVDNLEASMRVGDIDTLWSIYVGEIFVQVLFKACIFKDFITVLFVTEKQGKMLISRRMTKIYCIMFIPLTAVQLSG